MRRPDEPLARVPPPNPLPPVAAPTPPGPEPDGSSASITLAEVEADEGFGRLIASADRITEAMGFTEHGFRHAQLVGKIAYQVLSRLGYSEREAVLASVAGYLHDVGNAFARQGHAQTGALLVYQALRDRVDGADLMPIVAAIANHEETEGVAVSPVSAAVILADKSDVHRSRVRRAVSLDDDIHDRVNYSVEESFLRVDSGARTASLELTIDTEISSVMEYFEIFMGRMQYCRSAAQMLGADFRLIVNGNDLA